MNDPTPDLIAALEQVEAEAKRTQHKLAKGEAVNGSSGLTRIRHIATDAVAKARELEEAEAAA